MNDEQSQLVEKNIRLSYFMYERLTKTSLIIRYRDDLISEAFVGLVKAAETYEPDRAKFATYAARCITNQMLMFLRKLKKYECEVSLYAPIGSDDNGNELLLLDTIADGYDMESARVEFLTASQHIGKLPLRQKRMLDLRGQGLTHAEIGKKLGISQSYVSRIFAAMRRDYRKSSSS